MGVRAAWVGGLLSLMLCAVLAGQSSQPTVSYLSRDAARPVFDALGERLPDSSAWQEWIAEADRATRARVSQGDETSLVNWLLFGTSFTNEPRITSDQLDARLVNDAIKARLNDFERALDTAVGRDLSRALPMAGDQERFAFARRVLGNRTQVRPRLLSFLKRAIAENETYARLIREAQALDDPRLQFAERSRIYRARGLSSDTSVRTNFAVEEALRGLTPVPALGSEPKIRRVAIIGPGLDFTDKQEGFDFYPQQTIQPFALIDSLVRVDLARLDQLSVTTLDLSPRVNDHLERAAVRARAGSPYALHVPVAADVSWTPDFLRYWQSFGDRIGEPAPSPSVPGSAGQVKIRSVAVRPSVVGRITAHDVNITAQQLVLAGSERFDLVVATNVFVYYDRMQQGLAMVNIARMLKPGGFLLSNNALVEVPSTGLKSVGYTKTLYSDREEDGDLVISYRKAIQ